MDQFSATNTTYLNTLGPKSSINFKNSSEVELLLTSNNYDQQTHAIIWVPHHLNQHPNPLTINEWVLKLTRQFATSASPIKLLIIEALTKIQPHLIKVFNIEQIFQNLVKLMNTSQCSIEDQILSLRSLKSVNIIIFDNIKYHQLICNLVNINNLSQLNEELVFTCLECIELIIIHSQTGRQLFLQFLLELSKLESKYRLSSIHLLRHYGYKFQLAQDVYSHCLNQLRQLSFDDVQVEANLVRFALMSTMTRLVQQQPLLIEDYTSFFKHELQTTNDSSHLRILFENLIELLKDPKTSIYFKQTSKNDEWLTIIQSARDKIDTNLNLIKSLIVLKHLLKLRNQKINHLVWDINQTRFNEINQLPIALYDTLFASQVTLSFSHLLISNQLLTRLLIIHIDANSITLALPFIQITQSQFFKLIQPSLPRTKLILALRSLKYQIQFILKCTKPELVSELSEVVIDCLFELFTRWNSQKDTDASKLIERWIDSLIPQLLQYPKLIQTFQQKLIDQKSSNFRLLRLGLLTYINSDQAEQSPTNSDKISLPKVPLLDKLLNLNLPNSQLVPVLMDSFKHHFLNSNYQLSFKIITILKQYQPTVANYMLRLILSWNQLNEFEAKWHQKNIHQSNVTPNFNDLELICNQLKQLGCVTSSWFIELRTIYLRSLEGFSRIYKRFTMTKLQLKQLILHLTQLEGFTQYLIYLQVSFNFWFNTEQTKWIESQITHLSYFMRLCITILKLLEYAKYYKFNLASQLLERWAPETNTTIDNLDTFEPFIDSQLTELSAQLEQHVKRLYHETSYYPSFFFEFLSNPILLNVELPELSNFNSNNLYTIEYHKDHRLNLRFKGGFRFINSLTEAQLQLVKSNQLRVYIQTFDTSEFVNFNRTSINDQFQFYTLAQSTGATQEYWANIQFADDFHNVGQFECDILITPCSERTLRFSNVENRHFWNLGLRFSLMLVDRNSSTSWGLGPSVLSLLRLRLK